MNDHLREPEVPALRASSSIVQNRVTSECSAASVQPTSESRTPASQPVSESDSVPTWSLIDSTKISPDNPGHDETGHEEALLEYKRKARGQTPSGRLTAAVPEDLGGAAVPLRQESNRRAGVLAAKAQEEGVELPESALSVNRGRLTRPAVRKGVPDPP